MVQVSKVKSHPQRGDIHKHLTKRSMTVAEIINHYGTEEHPLTRDAVNWYRRKYVNPIVKEAEEIIKEETIDEVQEEWRRVEYRTIEIIDGLLNTAVKKWKTGEISINTVNEIAKLLELKAKVQGEIKEDITIRFAWGDKLSVCPRFKKPKGQIYTPEDLKMMM